MSISTKMLELIEASPQPITSKQIAETLNVRIETVASALTDLWKSKAVKRRGTERDGERGGRLYEYVHSSSNLEGFESLVLPLAKKTGKKKSAQKKSKPTQTVETPGKPISETVIPVTEPLITIPIGRRALTLTMYEVKVLHTHLDRLLFTLHQDVSEVALKAMGWAASKED